MIRKQLIIVTFLLAMVSVFIPSPAMAQGLFEHQDTFIPENQMVDNVVVAGGDATVAGSVRGAVIVMNGNLTIKASAHIQGIVLVIGGKLHQEQGADITDEIISFSFDDATKNSFLFAGGLIAGIWIIEMIGSILLVLLPIVTVLIGKHRLNPFVETVRQSPGRILLIGFFSSLLLLAVSGLLSISVIGIPVVFLILLVVALTFILGLAVISFLIGERFQGTFGRAPWFVAAIGACIITAAANIPFFGVIILACIAWISLGIMTMWMWEKIKRKEQA